jgi:chromosome partitioning protein
VFNALIASDYVVVPVSVGVLDFAGITGILELIGQVQKYSNPNLQLLGILLTRWTKNKLAKDLEKKIRGLFTGKVFTSVIPEAVATGVSWANRLPLTTSAPDAPVTQAYMQLTQEILNHEYQKRIAG